MEDLTGASEVLDKLLQDAYREGFLAGEEKGSKEAYRVAYAIVENNTKGIFAELVDWLGYDPQRAKPKYEKDPTYGED